MLALTTAAAFVAYLQPGAVPVTRMHESRVSSVSMSDTSWRRAYNGKVGGATMSQPAAAAPAGGKQDFLEASPYWDQSDIPINTYKNKAPFTAKVVSTKRIVGPQATGETCHIIMSHEGKMPYWEGQSYGVIPPGENPKKPGKPNTVRLYSIASSRYGDDMTGTTTSL